MKKSAAQQVDSPTQETLYDPEAHCLMTFSSKDPCGGLSKQNLMNVKDKLRRQKVFHKEYEPAFHGRNMQTVFKTLMKMPDELLSPTRKVKRELSIGKSANRNNKSYMTPQLS